MLALVVQVFLRKTEINQVDQVRVIVANHNVLKFDIVMDVTQLMQLSYTFNLSVSCEKRAYELDANLETGCYAKTI